MKRACTILSLAVAGLAATASAGDLQAASLDSARGLIGAADFEAGVAVTPQIQTSFGDDAAGVYWDNGEWDGRDGQASADGSFFPFARAADDFYLADGKYYYVDQITVQMLVKSPEDPISILELYNDCNGLPSTLRDSYEQSSFNLLQSDVFGVYDLYEITYDINCWLPGGCAYWVSPVGQARDCSCDGPLDHDQYFFCTTGYNASQGFGDVQGIEGHFLNPDLGFSDWTPASVTCSCKTDYCFKVYAKEACVLRDQGDFDGTLGAPSVISTAFPDQRTADDFVLPTSDRGNPDVYDIHAIQACVFTNCKVADYILEIYDTANIEEVDENGELTGNILMCPGNLIASYTLPKAIDLGLTLTTTEGFLVDGYQLQFDTSGLELTGGETYWVSAVGRGQGAIRDRSFFCFASNCRKPADCLISWMEPKYNKNVSAADPKPWQDLSEVLGEDFVMANGPVRNLDFKVFGSRVEADGSNGANLTPSDFHKPQADSNFGDVRGANVLGASLR
ncbi:MAG: hypothetical protein AAF138_04470 [Planctomycetota bacterium]